MEGSVATTKADLGKTRCEGAQNAVAVGDLAHWGEEWGESE